MTAPVLALDVGATRIKAALITADGSRVTESRHKTGRADGPGAVLTRVADVAAEVLAAAGSGANRGAACAGIAVCGAVRPDGLVTAVNLGWDAVAVGGIVAERIGLPVRVLNDAHAGALGEGDFGAAQGVRDYLYVSLGTGVGAAIVKDGELLRGAHGQAGELGHITVDPRGPVCTCGDRGCLQTYLSASALEERWREAQGSALAAREILDLVLAGDLVASELWASGIAALATGILTAMSLVDPAVVVLGGGLSETGARLASPLPEALAAAIRSRSRPFHAPVEVRLAAMGDWSGCAGAALDARRAFNIW